MRLSRIAPEARLPRAARRCGRCRAPPAAALGSIYEPNRKTLCTPRPVSKGYKVQRSGIHGRGLFAEREFAPRELIGVFEGDVCSTDGAYVLWVEQEDGTSIGIRGRNAIRFVNHSTDPNCAFNGTELEAIKHIQRGQELTCHYGEEWVAAEKR